MVFISDTDILDGIDSPKDPQKKNNSCGKTKIDDHFRSKYKKESELCIQIFLNPTWHSFFWNVSHHNFVVIAPMIMKLGTGIKLDVFYKNVCDITTIM